MRIHVEAYGCTMNRGEALEFADLMRKSGHEQSTGEADADAFAIFTCGVIETTERHMLRRIGDLATQGKPLVVGGCLPAICPGKIRKAAPGAMLVGPSGHMSAVGLIESGEIAGIRPMPLSVAMLPISTGCLGACTYCITRHARGGLRSRPIPALLGRARELVSRGAAEIQLCAQDTAAYGMDAGTGLGELAHALGEIEGRFMMRIGMMNPSTVLRDRGGILRAYENPKVFKFLHLPVQSGSDAVLGRMGRLYDVEDFRSIVAAFRERFPGIALSTDIIIGFPGETEADFRASMALMEDIRPDIINVTRFSPRPGTPAASMREKVPSWKAKGWSREMTALRFRITSENYSAMRGETVRALATERRKPGTTFMRTADYRPVVVKGELGLGGWHEVTVTGKARTHLSARPSEGS